MAGELATHSVPEPSVAGRHVASTERFLVLNAPPRPATLTLPEICHDTFIVPLISGVKRVTGSDCPWRSLAVSQPTWVVRPALQEAVDLTSTSHLETPRTS